ncbi:beta-galactosidase [Streptomyces ziwulingensis]|uniref:Glycoside hydrolase 35 catalytic domain-containing protein n=1 Tax=Streptomyces ziwulingensis TaxID=1045501 RepID=A0ABP9CMJ4_9ACTN
MLLLRAQKPSPPLAGHLPMGGPEGTPGAVSVNSRHVSRDGKPWIPVMGEFHFSRYPAGEWREELLKIRAGGIDVVATYLFWNQHEEQRGVLRFDGDLDVRRFVALCAELGLLVAVRIGPWSHGECRGGGFPDWLEEAGCVPRTDDPAYLALVGPYYARIARELRGLSHGEGGPIVAVQVENELYDQPAHLATLRRTAEGAGLRAPLWTATGWGAADIPEDVLLPLYGGYPEAFWEDAHEGWARDMRRHYFFTPIRDDHAIGADLRSHAPTGTGPDDRRYPYATCEVGGGMAIAYHRRPLVPAADLTSLALAKLGSGSVWQGYYLYHGCSQRLDHAVPNQESHDTGYPNDLPAVTYDFQAPLGEYGQVRPSFHGLRLQHLFLRDSGADLARMPLVLPETEPAGLDDRTTLRWAVRSDGDRGFLFVNNHQPHEPLPRHDRVRFRVRLDDGRTVTLPEQPVTVPSGAHFVWPIGHDLGRGIVLDWASAQPVTRLDVDGVPTTVLAATAGIPVTFSLPAAVGVEGPAQVDRGPDRTLVSVPAPGTDAALTLRTPAGRVRLLVLDEEQARAVDKVRIWGEDRLVLSRRLVVADGAELHVHTTEPHTCLALLPAPHGLTGDGVGGPRPDGVFTRWTLRTDRELPEPVVTCSRAEAAVPPARTGGSQGRASAPRDEDFDAAAGYRVAVPPEALSGEGEVLLRLAYTGDVARAYVGGRLVADHFWYGPDWEIGLRRLGEEAVEHGVEIRILPLARDSKVYVDASVRDGLAAAHDTAVLHTARLVPVHRFAVRAGAAGHA